HLAPLDVSDAHGGGRADRDDDRRGDGEYGDRDGPAPYDDVHGGRDVTRDPRRDSPRHRPAPDVNPLARLLDAPRDAAVALLHSCGAGPSFLLLDPVDELAVRDGDPDALGRIDAFLARHSDRRCAGWIGYDL